MSEIRNWPVVVAIDGSESSNHALTWAADEAARRCTTLVIAHAGAVCDFGRELLADAIAALAESHPEVTASTVLRQARVSELIADLSLGAGLVVVGRGEHSAFGRLVLGSNAERIATHSYSPVVVVASSVPVLSAPVVVGVSATENGKRAIQAACVEARVRDAELRAFRCWPQLYRTTADSDFSPSLRAMQESEQRILDNALATARREHPDIRIRGTLSRRPADVALSTVDGAGLVVLGCRRGIASHSARLGPITSWLLHHVDYPVMVVGEGKVVDAGATASLACAG